MKEVMVFFAGAVLILSLLFGAGYANNVADNNAIVQLVDKGVPTMEAKCAIRPSKECDTFLLLVKGKGD